MRDRIAAPAEVVGFVEFLRPDKRRRMSPQQAAALAREEGSRAAAEWIEDNPEAFAEGIVRGFKCDDGIGDS